jgi:hypothetical protein
MLKPVARAFAYWLGNEDHKGINALLHLVPLDDGEDELPRIVSIWDETRHDFIVDGPLPDDPNLYPALGIKIANADVMDGRTAHTWENGKYDLVVELLTREAEHPAIGKAQSYDILRALMLSIRFFNDPAFNPQGVFPRLYKGIHINTCENPRYVPTYEQLPGAWLAGAVLFEIDASDTLLMENT